MLGWDSALQHGQVLNHPLAVMDLIRKLHCVVEGLYGTQCAAVRREHCASLLANLHPILTYCFSPSTPFTHYTDVSVTKQC